MQASLFKSSIFRLTAVCSAGFLLSALILVMLLGGLNLSNYEQHAKAEMIEEYFWVESILEEDGLEHALGEVGDENGAIWEYDEGPMRLIEHDFVVSIRSYDGTVLAGMPDLPLPAKGWSWTRIGYEHEDLEIRLFHGRVMDEFLVTVGKIRGDEYHLIRQNMTSGMIWVLVSVLSLALITSFVLSRVLARRMTNLSEMLEEIGHKSLSERLVLSGRGDEFDRLASQVNSMLDRIEALRTNLEIMSAGVAHDLKTPLSRVSNRLQMMAQDVQDRQKLTLHIESAQAQLQAVISTFHGMLRLSEIDAGGRKLAFRMLDLSNLVEELSDSYEPVFSDEGRGLLVSILPGIQLRGDSELLSQLVSNLLENSLEHGTAGGNSWVRLQYSHDGVVLQIGDDGPGIPKDQRQQVFERFYRGDKSRSKPGNGLGLSIVKSICDLHDARIYILDDQPGAVFDIHLKKPGSG